MNQNFRSALCALVCSFVFASCMATPQADFDRYMETAAFTVEALTGTAIREGDLEPGIAVAVADGLDGLAAGSAAPAVGELASALNVGGYGMVVVSLAVLALDAQITQWGLGWDRWSGALGQIATAIRNAAEQSRVETGAVLGLRAGPRALGVPFTVEAAP